MPSTILEAAALVFRPDPPSKLARPQVARVVELYAQPVGSVCPAAGSRGRLRYRSRGGDQTSPGGDTVRFSRSVEAIPQSGIRELMELAWAVEDAIHLEVGDPSFPTPPHIVEAADRAAREGWTK